MILMSDGFDKIIPGEGEYVLFYDYHDEGLRVRGQYDTIEEAFVAVEYSTWIILRIVDGVFLMADGPCTNTGE